MASWRLLTSLVWLAGCAGSPDADDPPAATDAGTVVVVPAVERTETLGSLAPSFTTPELPLAIDPKLGGFAGIELTFPLDHTSTERLTCTIEARREGELVRSLEGRVDEACRATWDGTAWDGTYLAPGDVTLLATLSRGQDDLAAVEAHVTIVRVGVSEVKLEGERVPLLYRAMDGVRGGFYEVEKERALYRLGPDATEAQAATRLDLEDGSPREAPALWEDLTSPPLDRRSDDGAERDTYALPAAFVAGSTVEATLTLSTLAAGQLEGIPEGLEVRLVAPEGVTLSDANVADGATITATFADSPVPAVGRYDISLDLGVEARRDAEWIAIPGSIHVPLRLYGLAGEPTFDQVGVPHGAWVDVIDLVTGWVSGATREQGEVIARIVSGVYYELGLRYDVESGASAYTEYRSGGYEGAVFALSWFEERTFGDVINCSDAASIVSSFANMLGVDARYHIILHRTDGGFDLNYIQAIGGDHFTEQPFTSGRGGFSYHAVVASDHEIYDATLALDGDGTPTAAPFDLLLVQGLEPELYLEDLSSEWRDIAYYVDEKVELR